MPLDKPMSVEGLKEIVLNEMGHPSKEWERVVDHLITAVRAECKAVNPCERKCIDFCNAYEQGRADERARVLAEFRKMAARYPLHLVNPTRDAFLKLIQSLETPSQKP